MRKILIALIAALLVCVGNAITINRPPSFGYDANTINNQRSAYNHLLKVKFQINIIL